MQVTTRDEGDQYKIVRRSLPIRNEAGLVVYRGIELESWSTEMGILSPQNWLTRRKLSSQEV
jgi:hypothetical protein